MKVIQINTKSKSPKNELNNFNRIINNKHKNSCKNTKTRNFDFSSNKSKKKNYKRILPQNKIHFSSNNFNSTNTTNFNNSKTNNFIFFEHFFNFKDMDNLKQIKSLIKHHSTNSFANFNSYFANLKIKNNQFNKEKAEKKKKKDFNDFIKNYNKEKNNTDILRTNKNEKLYINTNYSVLLNNTKKPKDKKLHTNIHSFKNFFNSRPLTLNFSNDFNNFSSYKMLLNNKSSKYFSNYKPNYRKKLVINENTLKVKSSQKGNSVNKEVNKKGLMDNPQINNSNSYNILFTRKKRNLSYSNNSSSFSPVNKIKENKKNNTKKNSTNLRKLKNNKSLMGIGVKDNSIECVQINLYNNKKYSNTNNNKITERKNSSMKISENQNKIQYFNKIDNSKNKLNKNNINKIGGFILSQKSNHNHKKINNKKKGSLKSNNYYNINIDYETSQNTSKNKCVKITKKEDINDNMILMSPEVNHFYAVKQAQQIKNNYNMYV